MATKATDPGDQDELHRLADTYRKLAQDQPIVERSKALECRLRAEECRTLSEQFHNDHCKGQLGRLAVTYDALADQPEATEFLQSLK